MNSASSTSRPPFQFPLPSVVEERQVVELEAALALDGQVDVAHVVGAGHEADDAGDEEDEALHAGHGGDAVGDHAAQDEAEAEKDEAEGGAYQLVVLPDLGVPPPGLDGGLAAVVAAAACRATALYERRRVLRVRWFRSM